MQYLIQVAPVAPVEVMDILLALPETENISVYEDCVSAACRMPGEIAQLLVPKVVDWLRSSYLRFLPDKVEELITRLADAAQNDAVLTLARAFLVIYPDMDASFDRWKTQEILMRQVPLLVPRIGEQLLTLFFAVLITEVESLETNYNGWSSMWRPVIQTHDTRELRACELLLREPLGKEKVKSFVRMGSKMTPGSGNLRGPRTMDQGDGKIAQRSQNVRSGTRTETRTIFAKGDIADVVRGVLTAPLPSY